MFGDLSLLDAPKAEADPSNHLDLFFMPLKGEYCLFRILAYPAQKWDDWMNSGKKQRKSQAVPSPRKSAGKTTSYIYTISPKSIPLPLIPI